MSDAMSSCTANTSSISRSYRLDHSWYPSLTLFSCTVTRSRLPAVRTLPSSTDATCKTSPTVRTSFPLSWNADARAATRRPSIPLRPLINSSAIPSQK